MSHRTVTAAIATAALVLPGAAAASPLKVVAHLETGSVAQSAHAVHQKRTSPRRARRAVHRSAVALGRAFVTVSAQADRSPVAALDAVSQFTSAAESQAANLAAIVATAHGALESAAATALSHTAIMDASLVTRVSDGVDTVQSEPTPAEGQDLATVGADQAALSTTISSTASLDDLTSALQDQLGRAAATSVDAQASLQSAVADLSSRLTDAATGVVGTVLSQLQSSGANLSSSLLALAGKNTAGTLSIDTGGVPLAMLLHAEISLIG